MKRVIFTVDNIETIEFRLVSESQPIFAKEDGKLVGMVVHEDRGWITRIGGSGGASGHFPTLEDCIRGSLHLGYTYFVE